MAKQTKILFLLCGGTICTAVTVKEGKRIRSLSACPDDLFGAIEDEVTKGVTLVPTEYLGILSENMTVRRWNEMLSVLKRHLAEDTFDGIVIAHGTDTLAYTAAIFSMLLRDIGLPVFFVSANRPLSDPLSNGRENFLSAVRCIVRGIAPDVYVTYRNRDGRTYLHRGSRIRQCEDYSEDFFSEGMRDLSRMQETAKSDTEQIRTVARSLESIVIKDCVLRIEPYVGCDYSAYRYEKFDAVLHGTYHSGTVCTEKETDFSVLRLLNDCFLPVYFVPMKIADGSYESVLPLLREEGRFRPLYGCTKEAAYAKILIAYSAPWTEEERKAFIFENYNNEFFME